MDESKKLRNMLEDCYRQFNFYADEHERTGKIVKASTNRDFANRIKDLLEGTGSNALGHRDLMISTEAISARHGALEEAAKIADAEFGSFYDKPREILKDADGKISSHYFKLREKAETAYLIAKHIRALIDAPAKGDA